MATTIEGQSIYVGQIVKKVTVPDADIPATGLDKIIGPVFEMNHKDKVTVAVRVVSGPDISNVQLMRIFSDGVASEESISAGGFAADDGPKREHIFTHYFVGGNSFIPGIFNDKKKSKMAEERLKHADVVIDTDCGLDELKARVAKLWQAFA